jgi:glutathione S-transferase
MSLILFAHPFASYCQKALIALYENGTPFTFRMLDKSDPSTFAEFEALWPLKQFPLLLDEGRPIAEATIIIEPGRSCRAPSSRTGQIPCWFGGSQYRTP